MDATTSLSYTLIGIVLSVMALIGVVALTKKNRLYGEYSVIYPAIAYTLVTLAFGSGLTYILYGQILADDLVTSQNGVRNFIGVASALVALGGGLILYILKYQAIINVPSFNYFASFLIFEFCLMTTIVIMINKIWIINT